MNKKGDLPTTLLVIITIALIGIAIMSFITFDNGFEDKSKGISEMINEVDFNYNYIYAKSSVMGQEAINCKDCSSIDLTGKFTEIAKKRDYGFIGGKNLFSEINKGNFGFEKKNGYLTLEIRNLNVMSERGNSNISRSFDLKIEFEDNGGVHKVYK